MRRAILCLLLLAGCHRCQNGHYEKVWVEEFTYYNIMYVNDIPIYIPQTVPAHWEDQWVCDD